MPRAVVEFYETVGPGGRRVEISQALGAAMGVPRPGRLVARTDEYTDFLARLRQVNGVWLGLAARIRRENIPDKANLSSGVLAPLDLRNDEGLAERVDFLYDPQHCVLLVLRNRVLGATAVARIIAEVSHYEFSLQPILRADVWQRLNRLERVAAIEVRLPTAAYHPERGESIPSFANLLTEAETEVHALQIGLTLSVGRKRSAGLSKGRVLAFLDQLRRNAGVEHLVVRGSEGDGTESIDLIHQRLVYTGTVEYNGRRFDINQCQLLLRRALQRHREELLP